MPISFTQVVVVLSVLVAGAFAWRLDGRSQWRATLESRLLYGVPWGSIVTIAVVVAFYLFAQGGLRNWADPITFPYITWSFFYPTGLATAGIAHSGPNHLLSNMTATALFAPIAEYAWSHYPQRSGDATRAEGDSTSVGLLARPVVRAFVVFPAALLAAAFVTAVFSLGPGLGFSGAVFAIVGFALVTYPIPAVVATVATSALSLLVTALSQPVVREGIEIVGPTPPDWASIGFQAHLLGFLLGVLAAIVLLSKRGRHPPAARLFGATVIVGMAQSLWLLVWPAGDDVFVLYRGAGVVLVVALALVVTVAVAGGTRALTGPLSSASGPSRRTIALGWLTILAGLFGLSVLSAVAVGQGIAAVVIGTGVVLLILAVPALPAVMPDRWTGEGPMTTRQSAVVVLVVLTLVVAAPSLPLSLGVVDQEAVPEDGVTAGDYTVLYDEDRATGQSPGIDLGDDEFFASNQSGVMVVSPDRELWTVDTQEQMLAFDGNATVPVGSFDWREEIEVERTGWEVVGNDTVYAVDVATDDESDRTFQSASSQANTAVGGYSFVLEATADGFDVVVLEDGEEIGTAAIPDAGESTTVADLEIRTEAGNDAASLVVEHPDATVHIADEETFGGD